MRSNFSYLKIRIENNVGLYVSVIFRIFGGLHWCNEMQSKESTKLIKCHKVPSSSTRIKEKKLINL
jgi:hypothetical protein